MENKHQIMQNLQDLKPVLATFGVCQIGLFGSYSENEPQEHSDIDVLIDFSPNNETLDNYLSVCELLEKKFNNQKLDIVTKNGLSPYFASFILKQVIYA